MAGSMGLLAGLLVATALVMIACAGDSTDSAPAQAATPTGVAAAPQSNGIATPAVKPAPSAAVELVPTAKAATTPPPATSTPVRPASTPTPVSQPAAVDPQRTASERFLIRLKDDLDDPLGYCVDVRGFGAGIRLDADLQAHSCKTRAADDQAFAMMGDRQDSSVVLVDYDVCLTAAGLETGASILLAPCDDAAASQRFHWLDDGRLYLLAQRNDSQPMLCVGVAGGAGEPAGGRNHLRRDLMLRDCAATDLALITWNGAPNQ